MSDALVFDSCFGRSQIHLFLKKSGCVAPRTDLSFKVPTWSNRSGDASPSATQHSLIGNERSGGSSFWLDQNGEGGIRTHGAREDTLVFKTRAINHSTTSPGGSIRWIDLISLPNRQRGLKLVLPMGLLD